LLLLLWRIDDREAREIGLGSIENDLKPVFRCSDFELLKIDRHVIVTGINDKMGCLAVRL
jgi:hypothetical protein